MKWDPEGWLLKATLSVVKAVAKLLPKEVGQPIIDNLVAGEELAELHVEVAYVKWRNEDCYDEILRLLEHGSQAGKDTNPALVRYYINKIRACMTNPDYLRRLPSPRQ